MSQLKIAFIPTNVSGVNFYRVWQFAEAMRHKKMAKCAVLWYRRDHYVMHPWENDLAGEDYSGRIAIDIEKACKWSDAVVWMALHTPQSINLYMEMRSKYPKTKFIVEMDDYVFGIPSYNIANSVYRPGSELMQVIMAQIRNSDAMIVSTSYLKSLYDSVHKNVYVCENSVDLKLWRNKKNKEKRKINIGWVGGGTHNEDHEVAKEAIFHVLDKYKNVHFTCLHGCPEFYKNRNKIKWTHDFRNINAYPSWVSKYNFDIGIAPLVDNNFNRAKSNLRWLEYSALGIPTVASPLPHFESSISHGETGFLAKTADDWKEYLELLIEEPALRESVGRKARIEVKEKWNPHLLGARYKLTIQEILNAKSDTINPSNANPGPDRRPQQPAMV